MNQQAAGIDRLIINSPFSEPTRHWSFDRTTGAFALREGRRPAGFVRASGTGDIQGPGVFVPMELPNRIRDRVQDWRSSGYTGLSSTSRRLLDHWKDPNQREFRLFFCQIEAIETLLWLVEGPSHSRQGLVVPSDGGPFDRVCSKMATGTGKTIVMAMLVAWQVLNKVASPQDKRFSKYILVVVPGLTVKERLHVLQPSAPDNYYDAFGIVPVGMRNLLNQAVLVIDNWHSLLPEDPSKGPKVIKKGPESDEAFCKRVVKDFGSAKNIVVINDEAHHAWRLSTDASTAFDREELEEATIWVTGLDRIHAVHNIITAYDFTATPFVPTGKNATDEKLFPWIVSDFGLNDSIEAGLVKTPRVVVREDALPNARTLKPKLYHIYSDETVKTDLNRKRVSPTEPLPDLVTSAYFLLGTDWELTRRTWADAGMPTPPVMITVANRTETAARVANAFLSNKILIPSLCDPERLLHIDSRVLTEAESRNQAMPSSIGTTAQFDNESESEADDFGARALTKADHAELLRQAVDTVGKPGMPGEKIQNVISVGMLTEGWDTRTVTHIMGLRAFTSQLLCEQVVGRGLRRANYSDFDENGLFRPEYVNVFGVPFTFLPVEGQQGEPPKPPDPQIRVEAIPQKSKFAISWPNVVSVNHIFKHGLTLDLKHVQPLRLDALLVPTIAKLAPVVDGKPKLEQIAEIDLQKLAHEFRLQRIAFEVARDIYLKESPLWQGDRAYLMSRVVEIALNFIQSDRIEIEPPLFATDPMRRRILLALNMTRIVQHLWSALVPENTTSHELVFDERFPTRSTADMTPWYTSRSCYAAEKSHINYCVLDSGWEGLVGYQLDNQDQVARWVKNDHLGFEVSYVFRGAVLPYRPDLLVVLQNGLTLVLEVKGQDSEQARAKRHALEEWVQAVTGDSRFGRWAADTAFRPEDVPGIIALHSESGENLMLSQPQHRAS